MSKLHELLAVEPDLRSEAGRMASEVKEIFSNPALVTGMVRTYHPLVEGEELEPDEKTEMATTVDEELKRFEKVISGYIDTTIQKEVTNTVAKATLEIAGETIDLPATALLNLENRLAEIKSVVMHAPILDASEIWHYDDSQEVHVSETRKTFKTKKLPKSFVAYEATVEHPAQVQVFNEDVRVGERETILHSGALTLKRRRELLDNIDSLARKIKKARQRANSTEIVGFEIASDIFQEIFA